MGVPIGTIALKKGEKTARVTQERLRAVKKRTRPFRILFSDHFGRQFNREIIDVALLCLRFRSITATKSDPILSEILAILLFDSPLEEQYRRMVFNVVAPNHDDHVKNVAFLMDTEGGWSLAPAFDITYSYNPTGNWTACHQMTMNGKRNGFDVEDLRTCILAAGIKKKRGDTSSEDSRCRKQLA